MCETHCHTSPVSKCGKAFAEDTVRFYKEMGYDGLFITNHFLDGNINLEVWNWPYAEQIDYYFSDYEKAAEIGKEVGIKVFPGVELLPIRKTARAVASAIWPVWEIP